MDGIDAGLHAGNGGTYEAGELASAFTPEPTGQDMLGAFQSIHYRLATLFDTYEHARGALNENAQAVAVHGICECLKSYLALQMRSFYPLFRAVVKEGDLIVEVMATYARIKTLVPDVEKTPVTDKALPAKVQALGELIRHHIQLEETLVFPRLMHSDFSVDGFGGEFDACKTQLRFYCTAAATEPRVTVKGKARAVIRGLAGVGASVN
jgi:hypothetical protein